MIGEKIDAIPKRMLRISAFELGDHVAAFEGRSVADDAR
jgi:hypothetical protein